MTKAESTTLKSDLIKTDIEVLRKREDVRAELFDYLHAGPDCMTENLKVDGQVFKYCRQHRVTSAVIGEIGR